LQLTKHKDWVRALTYNSRKELAEHEQIGKVPEACIHFADPYSLCAVG